MDQFLGRTRLPDFAVPRRYDLRLKIDLSACAFSGSADILLDVRRATNYLVLNALDIEFELSSIVFTSSSSSRAQFRPSDGIVFKEDEILVLEFDEPIPVGEGVLSLNFVGTLKDDMKGLYRSTYVVNGEKKNMAVTQFEAVDARRCFPCWDEPALKATFKITLEVPSEMTALSNMPVTEEKVDGDLKIVSFEESPLMSTYLVAIVVGMFDMIEDVTSDGIKVCVFCPVGKSDQGKFGLDVAVKVLDLYRNYFSMPYPLPKLDMAAIPDFAAGAMENYGLITYRDTALLYDEKNSAAANKQWIAIVVAHEVAHQWFGNLVTMDWWTHLWLNEGFATWVSYLATDALFPEWKIWTQFLGQTTAGLRLDALAGSHPIEVEVGPARSVDEIFDAISYQKGASIIRMLQSYLGADIFQRSLASYIKKHAFKNARTEDLWAALSEESGLGVNSLMDTWTKQQGYPLVSVKLKDHILEFEQSQFFAGGSVGDGQWIVPLTLFFGLNKKNKNFLLESKTGNVDISDLFQSLDGNIILEGKSTDDEELWVKVNLDQTGFYRVKYDEMLAGRLRAAIKTNSLATADRFGILDDSYALCEACEQPLSYLLSLMDVYREELDYVVLSRLIDISIKVMKILTAAIPDSSDKLKAFVINLLLFSANKLGWDHVTGESHLNALLRGELLMALALFSHDVTLKEALSRFHIFLDDRNTPLLPADTRKAAYVSVMRNSNANNRTGFESLLKVYRETDLGQEKGRLLSSMASCPDPDIVLEVLNFLLSSEVRGQDVIYGLSGISWEGREIAWSWLKANWEVILNRWGSSILLTNFIRSIVTPFCSEDKVAEVEAFFASRVTPSISMTLKQSLEQARINARWVQSIKNEQSLGELIKELARSRE